MKQRLSTYLRQLEAESIHIIREAAAEFENPVMLYSIGKDSSVMVRLALRAFHPGRVPFPMLHVDTTWKFRDMYALRDRVARESGMELIVYRNPEAVRLGIKGGGCSGFSYVIQFDDDAPRVAELMAEELGRDESWVERETRAFEELARGYLCRRS